MDGLITLVQMYTPYAVLGGVILLFFLCCYILFRSPSVKVVEENTYAAQEEFDVQKKERFPNPYQPSSDGSSTETREDEWEYEPVVDMSSLDQTESDVVSPSDETVAMAIVKAEGQRSAEEDVDATRVIPKITDHMVSAIEDESAKAPSEPVTLSLIDTAVSQFVASYGVLNPQAKELATDITEAAFTYVGMDEDQMQDILQHIVVQESLLNLQKAYVATPTDWMRGLVLDAFKDVVTQPRSSTLFLIATDALRKLVHLTLGHLQALALSLLVQYSRNSNNYSLENFRHYVEKYIEPFLSELPRHEDMYKQLEFLHCLSRESQRTTFEQLMMSSYPLVFNYRGFSHDELEYILQGKTVEAPIIVPSMSSSLLQLAVVDATLIPRLLRRAGITDETLQEQLTQLAHSKPVDWENHNARDMWETISPLLLDFRDVYNAIPLSQVSLTLLGLYLGKTMVKVVIHEDFDISPWVG